MPFNPEAPFGDNFTTDNDTQAGLVSLFIDIACDDSPPQGDDLIWAIRESMSPFHLVHPDMAKKLHWKLNLGKDKKVSARIQH